MAPEPVASAAATPTAARSAAAQAERTRAPRSERIGAQPAMSSAIRTITWAWRTEAMSMSRPL